MENKQLPPGLKDELPKKNPGWSKTMVSICGLVLD